MKKYLLKLTIMLKEKVFKVEMYVPHYLKIPDLSCR